LLTANAAANFERKQFTVQQKRKPLFKLGSYSIFIHALYDISRKKQENSHG